MLTVELTRARIGPGTLVLDLGCGAGRHAFACLKAGARVVALDAAPAELAPVKAMCAAMQAEGEAPDSGGATAVGADALRLPFADASFDCVIAAEVLEHVADDRLALGELARVLRPGGTLALSVPRAGPEALNWALSAEYHGVEGGHVRIYRLIQLLARLTASGFVPRARHHAHGLHTPYWWLRCLVGVARDHQPVVATYHRFLVWDLVEKPAWTRRLEAVLNPIIGKSLVLYCTRTAAPGPAAPGPATFERVRAC